MAVALERGGSAERAGGEAVSKFRGGHGKKQVSSSNFLPHLPHSFEADLEGGAQNAFNNLFRQVSAHKNKHFSEIFPPKCGVVKAVFLQVEMPNL